MLKKNIALLLILILSIFIIQAVPTQKKTAEFHNAKFIGDLNCRLPSNNSHPNSVPTDNIDKSNTPDNKANPTVCCPTLIVNCSCALDKGNKPITPPFSTSIDSDSDGLPDKFEQAIGIDPFKKDSFGDGIDDYTRIIILKDIPSQEERQKLITNNTSVNTTVASLMLNHPVDSDKDGLPDYIENSGILGYKTDPNKADTDSDGLNDLEEYWWQCDPTNPDTNNDGMRDGPSVDYNNPTRTYPYKGTLEMTIDIDGDGLPTAAEINDPRLKTNFKEYSTDGDPYGDGQEYFHIGIPDISPADSPLVAAYPSLKVVLSRIDYTPTGEITTTNGTSTQKAWSEEVENSQTSQITNEVGVEVGVEAGYDQGPKCVGHVNAHYTYTNTQETGTSETTSASGFNQNDWSTADTTNKEKAALVSLVFNVENGGMVPAQEITPFINLKLNDQVIATIGSRTKITSLPGGSTSKDLAIKNDENGVDIALSLDQLRSIECGAPLTIETLQVDAKVKKWDDDKKEWVPLESDFSNYMDEINRRTATIVVMLDDGTWREYKVVAGLTLGEAFNLTVRRDQSINGINISKMGWLFPLDAYVDISKLLQNNKSNVGKYPLLNLALKPGWTISVRTISDDLKIGWASYNKEQKVVLASVTSGKRIREGDVWAHVKIGNRYENLTMVSPNNNTIYSNWSKEEFEIDGNCYVMATDIGNNTEQFNLAVPVQRKLSRLMDGDYVIVSQSRDSPTMDVALNCSGEDNGYNVYRASSLGGLSQIWHLRQIKNGIYSIENKNYPGHYLEVDDAKQSDGANVQAGKYDKDNLSQQWRFVPKEMGFYSIQALHSGKSLKIDDIGGSIIQEKDHQKGSQKWVLQPVDSYPINLLLKKFDGISSTLSGPVSIMPASIDRIIGRELSSRGFLVSDRTNRLYVSDQPSLDSFFYLVPRGDGYFEILDSTVDNCLQVFTPDLSNKSNGIQLNFGFFDGRDNQLWKFKPRGAGTYEICAKYSNKCINVMPLTPNVINQWDYQGYGNQRFYIKFN